MILVMTRDRIDDGLPDSRPPSATACRAQYANAHRANDDRNNGSLRRNKAIAPYVSPRIVMLGGNRSGAVV
jgi:hypothetical protein